MAETLWTASELAATGGTFDPPPRPSFAVTGVSIDSRTLRTGDLFVALHGARDGHEFVAKAFEGGAAAAMVDRPLPGLASSQPLLFVDDTQRGLERLGETARRRSTAQRIGVTGSVGKTSTKEALRLALGATGKTHASEASYNNLWGVPLTLARMPKDARFGVFEIGMNHAREITPLSQQVRPHAVIITTVEPVHLEFFDSVEEIAEAKAEIFAGLLPGGAAILPHDNPHYERLALRARERGARVIRFGEEAPAEAHFESIELGPTGSIVRARILGSTVSYRLSAPGRHVARNSLAVLAGAAVLGADLKGAADALSSVTPPPGRGARIEVPLSQGCLIVIDESYNANPASMRAAIANLALQAPQGARRIAVLGDMLELGPSSADLHASLAEPLQAAHVDLVFASGTMMKNLFDRLPQSQRAAYAPTSAEIAEAVAQTVRPGDTIMIKGSLGSRMKAVVDRLQAMGQEGPNRGE